MKRTNRPSSIGSTAGVFTRCCTPSNKPSSVPSPEAKELLLHGRQTTVYLNSLELQAALTNQQVAVVHSEAVQLQHKSRALKFRLEALSRRRQLNEAAIITQETEIARIKLRAVHVSTQNLPKRLNEMKQALEEQLMAFVELVGARKQLLEQTSESGAEEARLDRVSELILGQVKMYETRLSQQEQEIRVMGNRFQQELTFLREACDLVQKHIAEQKEMHEVEVRKTLRIARQHMGRGEQKSKKRNKRVLSV